MTITSNLGKDWDLIAASIRASKTGRLRVGTMTETRAGSGTWPDPVWGRRTLEGNNCYACAVERGSPAATDECFHPNIITRFERHAWEDGDARRQTNSVMTRLFATEVRQHIPKEEMNSVLNKNLYA